MYVLECLHQLLGVRNRKQSNWLISKSVLFPVSQQYRITVISDLHGLRLTATALAVNPRERKFSGSTSIAPSSLSTMT